MPKRVKDFFFKKFFVETTDDADYSIEILLSAASQWVTASHHHGSWTNGQPAMCKVERVDLKALVNGA
jgi:hypothetical protein